jgi:phosphate transport system substrate-binding protein
MSRRASRFARDFVPTRGHAMHRAFALLAAALTFCVAPLAASSSASGAVTHAQISGSGSSWAANAINQWISDVSVNEGLQVVFTAAGSAQGRTDFRNVTTDFAVSDIGFQGVDSATGDSDTNCTNPAVPSTCRPYAYLPIVAGGTSFPYQIRVGGQLVTNLRLSGETLTKIFTNKITNWDDPEITADNNGRKLPSLPIIPVVHSEGSGSTAQFTRYMNTEYPSLWRPFSDNVGMTEYFPRQDPQVAQNGSDGVINFVTSAAANGAIGYDEYSYALGKNYPVAQLENKAGYFTSPNQYNVAVALTRAQINYHRKSKNYLLQNLNNVYTSPDKRAYAMSSYSYMIIPTSPTDPRMTTAKRQTLADFLFWDICGGQQEMGPIGYSPLPINLVEASFQQTNLLHKADKSVQLTYENVTHCHNPTFVAGHPTENYLAEIAPEPPLCDKSGQGPCAPGGAGTGPIGNPTHGKAPKPTNTPSPGTTASSGTNPGTGGGGPDPGSTSNPGGTSIPGAPVPGSTSNPGVPGTTTTQQTQADVIGNPTTLPGSNNGGVGGLLAVLAGIELLLVLAIPPIIAKRIQHRRASQ